MADCQHKFALTHTEPAPGSATARTVTFTCQLCGEQITKITNRTDADIATELAAQ